jgi:hypothetical protein
LSVIGVVESEPQLTKAVTFDPSINQANGLIVGAAFAAPFLDVEVCDCL